MSRNDLPAHASVVVIGGGVMGCSTLYHLGEMGVSDAILLERNKLTSGTTWHSAAQVRALRSTRNLTDLIRHSISLYSRLEEQTGQATGWINKGSLSIATTEDRLVHIKRQEALAHLFGVRARSVSADEAKEIWPLMNANDVIGAVWSPDDGRVSPSDLCAALVKGARARGARIREDTAVTGILTRGGRVTGIETDRGTVRCDAVALCTGLWSRKVAAMAGVEVPVWPCEHFYLLTRPIDGIEGNVPSLSDHDGHLYIRDDSGGLLIGCFESHAKPIDPDSLGEDFAFQLLPEDWDHFEPMMMNALHRLPTLETAQVKMLLNGPESFTPDGSFLLGEATETRGLFLGCGMNSVGVATGGGAGMALAHCIVHGQPPMDLHEADPKRFPSCFNSAAALAERVPEVLGKHYEITYPARQWVTSRGLRPTPLESRWRVERAHFGQVYGFERPLYFGKDVEPVGCVRLPSRQARGACDARCGASGRSTGAARRYRHCRVPSRRCGDIRGSVRSSRCAHASRSLKSIVADRARRRPAHRRFSFSTLLGPGPVLSDLPGVFDRPIRRLQSRTAPRRESLPAHRADFGHSTRSYRMRGPGTAVTRACVPRIRPGSRATPTRCWQIFGASGQ